ncbi:FHA domain-containing protein [Microbacterium sp. ARD32]|uniref:FHA domain-containing protein n=1 Tax=Microbacterium sp. ARD32 TaxID=2962577 RepID=UPI0028818B25|nr:FHA domain-containing protein [Microbacterium sp. ARD32]MDT0156135.1 FHA domain-containing protein [Microbacterium sp. ARD32]
MAPASGVSPAPSRPGAASVVATSGQRAGAYLIDVAIVAVAAALVWLVSGSLVLLAVTVIELWAIAWVWEGHTGATPGNLACGIRTVRRDSEVTVGARRLLPRSLLMGVAHVIPVLLPVGLAAAGALDGVSGARMIDVRKARLATAAGGRAPSLEARVTAAGESTVIGTDGAVIASAPISRVPGAAPASIAPASPASAPAQPQLPDAGTVPVFELADGTVVRASGLGFIGRAPRAPESIPDAILVRVPDGARSLSRTHAAFGIEDGDLWVQDLGSANGASVRHLGGGVTDLASQTPYFLVPGDVLVLGGDAELAFRRVLERSAPPAPQPAAQASAARASAAESDAVAPASDAPDTAAPAETVAGPVAPAPEPAPMDALAQAVVALQFQDGSTMPITGIGYIGRAPSLPDGERPDAALVAVPDGDRSVSRTHGRFGVVDGQAWFEDLGSGNGSMLRTGDGRSGPMTPHQRFGLVPGMVLQLGDCVIRIIAA